MTNSQSDETLVAYTKIPLFIAKILAINAKRPNEHFIPGLLTVVPRAINIFPVSLTSISLKTTIFLFFPGAITTAKTSTARPTTAAPPTDWGPS